jgi:hypothetical protein
MSGSITRDSDWPACKGIAYEIADGEVGSQREVRPGERKQTRYHGGEIKLACVSGA